MRQQVHIFDTDMFRCCDCCREEGIHTAEQLAEIEILHEKTLLDQGAYYEEQIRDEIAATRRDEAAKTEARLTCTRDLYEQQLQVCIRPIH